MDFSTDLVAPLTSDAAVGTVRVSLAGESVADMPLVVLKDVAEAGFLARLKDEITLWLQ